MDFDKEEDDIILLLLAASGVTNVWSILSKSRRQLAMVKRWLHHRSVKCLSQHIGTKTTKPLQLLKIFSHE